MHVVLLFNAKRRRGVICSLRARADVSMALDSLWCLGLFCMEFGLFAWPRGWALRGHEVFKICRF